MEKIDGLTPQIIGMIDDLMDHRWRMKDHSVNAGETDEYGFPFEPDHLISAAPLGFYESAMRLQTQASELYSYVYSLNRHSPLFAKASALLEKLVRQLGICCITKAVLEQEGSRFEMLDGLTVGWLRSVAAFNVRKCYSAFMEDRELNVFNGSVMDLSIRWTALDKRLTATGDKIEKILAGKIGSDLSGTSAVQNAADEDAALGEKPVPAAGSAFAETARALPVDRDAVRAARKQEASGQADDPADAVTPDAAPKGTPSVSSVPTCCPVQEIPYSNIDEISDSCAEPEPYGAEDSGDESDPAETGVPEWLIRRMFGVEPDFQIRAGSVPETAPPWT